MLHTSEIALQLMRLTATAPGSRAFWNGVFIALGLAYALAMVLAWQDWRRNRIVLRSIRALEVPLSAAKIDEEVAKLKLRDPAFDAAAFVRQAGELFLRVQAARRNGALPPRHEVSDGVYRRAVVEREIEKAQGTRAHEGDLALREARLVGAFSDTHFDALHVRMAFTSRRLDVPAGMGDAEATAKAAAGKVPESLHAEVWVFVRRPSAKTLAGRAPGKCPNCGALFEGGAANLCGHCQAILNSGAYDWVLAQVLDYEVYRGPWRQFTGYEAMVERDPAFSVEAIEDRGALLFWKWVHARSERKVEIARRLCAAELAEVLAAEARDLEARRKRRWIWDVKVAGVDLLLLELDSHENRDEACVRVRWSARVAEYEEQARPTIAPSSFATVLTMVRAAGAKTDVSTGVSSDRCHACRAASQDGDADTCSFCGVKREPGKHDFVLRDARAFEDWMAHRQQQATLEAAVAPYVPAFKFADERLRLLQLMAAMARADGEVGRIERAHLKTCCRRWGVGFDRVRPTLDGEAAPPEGLPEKGSWPARALLEALCDAAAIDGVIDHKERAMLVSVARRLGVEAPTVHALKARADAVRRTLRQAGLHDS